jgi:hypothetical protein
MNESLQAARERMERAKVRFSEAAKAALCKDPQAPAMAVEAFREVQEAREALRALGDRFMGREGER